MTDTPPPTLDVATLAARIEWLEKLFKFDDDVAMITAPNDPVTGGKCILEVASFDAMNAELRASQEEIARLRMVLTESATHLRTISDFGGADDATVDTVLEIIDAALG